MFGWTNLQTFLIMLIVETFLVHSFSMFSAKDVHVWSILWILKAPELSMYTLFYLLEKRNQFVQIQYMFSWEGIITQ